jgi:hypothetical protein
MGILHRIDRRSETRTPGELIVTVWGIDTKGDRFLQQAQARQISVSGALLCGLDVELRSGDLLGLLYHGNKARFRVVWVRYSEGEQKVQAAIHRVEGDSCPWREMLSEDSAREETSCSRQPSQK